MNYEELRRYIHDLQQSGFDVVRLRVELNKKLSYPLITLIMAILAVPFSLSAAKRGAVTGVAVALGIAVFYTVVSRLFEAMGDLSQLPPALGGMVPGPDLCFVGWLPDFEGSDVKTRWAAPSEKQGSANSVRVPNHPPPVTARSSLVLKPLLYRDAKRIVVRLNHRLHSQRSGRGRHGILRYRGCVEVRHKHPIVVAPDRNRSRLKSSRHRGGVKGNKLPDIGLILKAETVLDRLPTT